LSVGLQNGFFLFRRRYDGRNVQISFCHELPRLMSFVQALSIVQSRNAKEPEKPLPVQLSTKRLRTFSTMDLCQMHDTVHNGFCLLWVADFGLAFSKY
jgi:hypothetical protein